MNFSKKNVKFIYVLNDSDYLLIIKTMYFKEARVIIAEKNLKVTPQRVMILDAIIALNNHPAAEQIIESVRRNNPNISVATVYKVLETFVEKKIISVVTAPGDARRYEIIHEEHHHMYHIDSKEITDYYDEELNDLLKAYFFKKSIPGFNIENINVQISGVYRKEKATESKRVKN